MSMRMRCVSRDQLLKFLPILMLANIESQVLCSLVPVLLSRRFFPNVMNQINKPSFAQEKRALCLLSEQASWHTHADAD